jgi:hypothetical protein
MFKKPVTPYQKELRRRWLGAAMSLIAVVFVCFCLAIIMGME